MTRHMTRTAGIALALVAVALAACTGAAAGGPGSSPVATPGATPIATPTTTPVVTPRPTAAPSDGGSDAMPITVELADATGHDVRVDIVDHSGRIVRATSGTPGDGASVAPHTITAENVDDRTIRLTWSAMPGDSALALYVDDTGNGLVLVQPEHDGDSIAFDRILVLQYDGPVSADDLRVSIQDGLDTPG